MVRARSKDCLNLGCENLGCAPCARSNRATPRDCCRGKYDTRACTHNRPDVGFWGWTCRFALHMSAFDPKRTPTAHYERGDIGLPSNSISHCLFEYSGASRAVASTALEFLGY